MNASSFQQDMQNSLHNPKRTSDKNYKKQLELPALLEVWFCRSGGVNFLPCL